eukprot:3437561-Rhodomonas_salina.1
MLGPDPSLPDRRWTDPTDTACATSRSLLGRPSEAPWATCVFAGPRSRAALPTLGIAYHVSPVHGIARHRSFQSRTNARHRITHDFAQPISSAGYISLTLESLLILDSVFVRPVRAWYHILSHHRTAHSERVVQTLAWHCRSQHGKDPITLTTNRLRKCEATGGLVLFLASSRDDAAYSGRPIR